MTQDSSVLLYIFVYTACLDTADSSRNSVALCNFTKEITDAVAVAKVACCLYKLIFSLLKDIERVCVFISLYKVRKRNLV